MQREATARETAEERTDCHALHYHERHEGAEVHQTSALGAVQ